MHRVAGFKVSPITCKTKTTDGVKHLNGLLGIINKRTSFFKNVNLPFCSYNVICISMKNVPLDMLILRKAGADGIY